MTTARPRHQVTETPAVAAALDQAAQRWPGEPRSRLLVRLVVVGSEALHEAERSEADAHRSAVLASSGAYPDAFPVGYLARLREDWPE